MIKKRTSPSSTAREQPAAVGCATVPKLVRARARASDDGAPPTAALTRACLQPPAHRRCRTAARRLRHAAFTSATSSGRRARRAPAVPGPALGCGAQPSLTRAPAPRKVTASSSRASFSGRVWFSRGQARAGVGAPHWQALHLLPPPPRGSALPTCCAASVSPARSSTVRLGCRGSAMVGLPSPSVFCTCGRCVASCLL